MTDFQKQVSQIVKCPVCLDYPRQLPVRSCGAGHIICESCFLMLVTCPMCRGSLMEFNTNTIAGQLLSILPYSCKYKLSGCDLKFNISTIDEHERQCPERKVQCGFRGISKKKIIYHLLNDYLDIKYDPQTGVLLWEFLGYFNIQF